MTFLPPQCLLMSVALAATAAMHAQLPQQPAGATLSIGQSAAQPGAPVVAPLTLATAEGVELGSVTVRLTYPKALLSFVKVEPSGLALGVGAVIESKIDVGRDATSTTLIVKVFTAPASGRSLPPGPLAYLGFKISETAKPESAIALVHAAEALTAGEPRQPLTPVVAGKATIRVAPPPVPACFFYMH